MYAIRNIINGKFVANSDSDSANSYTNRMIYIQRFATFKKAEAAQCPMNEEIVKTSLIKVRDIVGDEIKKEEEKK